MTGLYIAPYICPMPGCVGGRISDDHGGTDRCLHCAGSGLTDDPVGGAERAPRPPGVMKAACGDCAYRLGSPEREALGMNLPEEEPFYCHQGLPVSAAGRYEPIATFRGLPLGAMVCAGWWALKTGEALPAAAYREKPITEDDVDKRWGAASRANIARTRAHQRLARARQDLITLLSTGGIREGDPEAPVDDLLDAASSTEDCP